MNKILLHSITLVFLLFSVSGYAQADYAGSWKGAVEIPGMNLELSIDLKNDQGKWSGDMDIPLQGIKDMALSDLKLEGAKLGFKLPGVPGNASFAGSFDDKGEKLEGLFTQGGQSFPMKLKRESLLQKAAGEKRLADAVSTLQHLVDSLMPKRHTPGLAFGIVKDGKVLMANGFGYRDLDKKLPVTANTQFAIGSSSKAFTALSLSILADRGQMEWDKPVVNYMPDFKLYDEFATKEMTATDLCCHRSGLPRHDMMWYGSAYTRQDIYDRLRYLPPNKSLRTTWQYNNLMFMTAGLLVERLSGDTWEKFVQANIFQPLGMKNSNFSVKDLSAYPEAASGYLTKDEKNIRLDYRNLDAIGPAGSINSTVNDMLQWVKLHLGDGKVGDTQVVSETELKHVHTPQMLMDQSISEKSPELNDMAYGLGWMVYRDKGLQVVEHGGNIDGFSALVYMVPEKDFGLVILSNQNAAGLPMVLARYATDLVLGLDYTDWYARAYGSEDKKDEKKEEDKKPEPKRVSGTQPSHALDAYVGEFEHPAYGRIKIVMDNKALRLQYNSFNMPLEHWHYDLFRGEDKTLDISMMLNFQTDQNGVIDRFSMSTEPTVEDAVFKRAAPAKLSDPAFLKQLTGKFKFEDDGPAVTFELRNTTLYALVPGQPLYTLVPFQGTEFKLKGLNGYSIEFNIDNSGKVTEAIFMQPNGVFKVKRDE